MHSITCVCGVPSLSPKVGGCQTRTKSAQAVLTGKAMPRGPRTGLARSADAPPLRLLVGVMSFRSPVAFGRRQAIRAALSRQQPAPGAMLRFVISVDTPDSDATSPDMLPFKVPESSRILGTYLLNNAFFRYAVALRPRVEFIARADDDSIYDMPTVLHELAAAACTIELPKSTALHTARGRPRRIGATAQSVSQPDLSLIHI